MRRAINAAVQEHDHTSLIICLSGSQERLTAGDKAIRCKGHLPGTTETHEVPKTHGYLLSEE